MRTLPTTRQSGPSGRGQWWLRREPRLGAAYGCTHSCATRACPLRDTSFRNFPVTDGGDCEKSPVPCAWLATQSNGLSVTRGLLIEGTDFASNECSVMHSKKG